MLYQLHKAYLPLYQVQHFRYSLVKHATLSTICSSLHPEQRSASTQALQQCLWISTANAIKMGPPQQRTGQHHRESGQIWSFSTQLYSFCESTGIITQRMLSLQIHTRYAGGGGKIKRHYSLLAVIWQHWCSEVLTQSSLSYWQQLQNGYAFKSMC